VTFFPLNISFCPLRSLPIAHRGPFVLLPPPPLSQWAPFFEICQPFFSAPVPLPGTPFRIVLVLVFTVSASRIFALCFFPFIVRPPPCYSPSKLFSRVPLFPPPKFPYWKMTADCARFEFPAFLCPHLSSFNRVAPTR